MAELSNCNRDSLTHKTKNIYSLPIYRKVFRPLLWSRNGFAVWGLYQFPSADMTKHCKPGGSSGRCVCVLPPPQFVCWSPISQCYGIWRWRLWKVIKVRWGQEGGVGPPSWGSCPNRKKRKILFTSPCERTARDNGLQARRRAEPNFAAPTKYFCYLRHPICGTLSWPLTITVP